jgi:hypothetical protein
MAMAAYGDRYFRRIRPSRPTPGRAPHSGGLVCARLTVATMGLRSRVLQRSLPLEGDEERQVRSASDLIGAEPAKTVKEESSRRGRTKSARLGAAIIGGGANERLKFNRAS